MLLTSEYLKTKRTAMRWLVFLVPVILPSLVAGYVWTRGWEAVTQCSSFNYSLKHGQC